MRPAHLEFDWGDGPHRFALPIKQLRELQERTGVGPYALYRRLLSHDWRADDLLETLRLGLIGGGAPPVEALRLVRLHVEGEALVPNVDPALRILAWALLPDPGAGDEIETDKKKPKRRRSRTSSTSEPFTETAS